MIKITPIVVTFVYCVLGTLFTLFAVLNVHSHNEWGLMTYFLIALASYNFWNAAQYFFLHLKLNQLKKNNQDKK